LLTTTQPLAAYRFKFVVHRPTGLVVAEKAVKEFPQVRRQAAGDSRGRVS
jgi:hypothetical protein